MGEGGGGEGTAQVGKNLAKIKCNVEKEPLQPVLIEGAFSWPIEFTGEDSKVKVALKGEAKGDLVWTGPPAEKPTAEAGKAQLIEAATTFSKLHFVTPLTSGWPEMTWAAGDDVQVLGKEWEKGKEGSNASIAIGELTLLALDFKTPGAKTDMFTVELKCDAVNINLSEPLASGIGKLTGQGEMILVAGDYQATKNLKIKGGLAIALEASASLVTFQDVLEGIGVDILITASFIIAGVLSIAEVVDAFATVDGWTKIPGKLKDLTSSYVSAYLDSCRHFMQGGFTSLDFQPDLSENQIASQAGTHDGYERGMAAYKQYCNGDLNAFQTWFDNNESDLQTEVTSTAMLHFQTEMWKRMGTGQGYQKQQGTWLWIWQCDPKSAGQMELFTEVADKSAEAWFLSGSW